MSLKINPLDIPEIIRMVGRCVDDTSQTATMQVSRLFHKNVAATAWETVVVDYKELALYKGSQLDIGIVLPWKSLELYGRHVRSVSIVSDMKPALPGTYSRPSIPDFWNTLRDLPLLNSVTLFSPQVVSWSLPYLRHHFPNLTVVSALITPPGFWGEVLSSCPALESARSVTLSLSDIVKGPEWVSTRLVNLDLQFSETHDTVLRRKLLEDELFKRIAKLVKLENLKVMDGGWLEDGQPLNAQSWEALSKINTLTYLELGEGFFGKLDDGIVAGLSKLRGLKKFRAPIPRKNKFRTQGPREIQQNILLAKINNLGVSLEYA